LPSPDEIIEIIERIRATIGAECLDNIRNIDGCRVVCNNKGLLLKMRFDNCANNYFERQGGCDCIFLFCDKIFLIECKKGKFGSSDAKKAINQIKSCNEFIRDELGYRGFIEVIIYYGKSMDPIAITRLKIELKSFILKIFKCGESFN